jgi:hypothetical protein
MPVDTTAAAPDPHHADFRRRSKSAAQEKTYSGKRRSGIGRDGAFLPDQGAYWACPANRRFVRHLADAAKPQQNAKRKNSLNQQAIEQVH